jgi:hypothetical protein
VAGVSDRAAAMPHVRPVNPAKWTNCAGEMWPVAGSMWRVQGRQIHGQGTFTSLMAQYVERKNDKTTGRDEYRADGSILHREQENNVLVSPKPQRFRTC